MSKRARSLALAAELGVDVKTASNGLVGEVLESSADCSGGTINPAITGPPHCLNAIIQSSEDDGRVGNDCILDSIHVTGLIYTSPVVNSNDPYQVSSVFLALVQDKNTNSGGDIAYSSLNLKSEFVFSNPCAATGGCTTPVRNQAYLNRFRVWRSQTFVLPPSPMVVTVGANPIFHWSGVGVSFDWFLPVNTRVHFSGSQDSIIGISDHSFHLIAFTSSPSTFANITYNSRVRFRG